VSKTTRRRKGFLFAYKQKKKFRRHLHFTSLSIFCHYLTNNLSGPSDVVSKATPWFGFTYLLSLNLTMEPASGASSRQYQSSPQEGHKEEEAIMDCDQDDPLADSTTSAAAADTREDKYVIFENWLRSNGAQFPLLELRKYNKHTTVDESKYDYDDDLNLVDTADMAIAEEKKDCGAAHEDNNNNLNNLNNNKEEEEEDDGSGEMRSVHAKSYIPPHTVCVSIPKSCLITVEMGQSTPIGKCILNAELDLDAPKHIYLMIYILWDKKIHGNESFFTPYYDILPRKLRNMPIFWNDDELAELRGSYILVQIDERKRAIRDDYESICAIVPNFRTMATLDEFIWARMIVCSRNFGLLINGVRTSALVPHADMLNHYRPRETKWTYDEEIQAFTITTLQSIGPGMEVYDSYGQKCNHRFLLNYGFCVEKNIEGGDVNPFCPNEVCLEFSLEYNCHVIENEIIRNNTTNEEEQLQQQHVDRIGGVGIKKSGTTTDQYQECWEKKLAFWLRGENSNNSSSTGRGVYGYGNGGGDGGGSHSSESSGDTLLHGMLSTLTAGNVHGSTNSTTTSTNLKLSSSSLPHPLNWSTDIINNVRSMYDQSSTCAVQEAFGCRHGGGLNNATSSTSSLTTTATATTTTAASSLIRRVRVCVSNNDNTRIAFSILRVLACTSTEIDMIGGTNSLGRYTSGVGLMTPTAQRLFGITPSSITSLSSSSAAAVATAAGGGNARTCQDVRYPINLRNERRAMELLLALTEKSLSAYPTTLAQDEIDLDNEILYPKFSNRRNAKLQVRGEKEVLHHYTKWASTAIYVIDVILNEIKIEMELLHGGSGCGSHAGCKSRSKSSSEGSAAAMGEEIIGFEHIIQAMEVDDECHSTILRYCTDVLGAVRREEYHRLRSLPKQNMANNKIR